MGNYITFAMPNTEASWTHAIIERSLLQSTSYSGLTSQAITNNTYYDENGSTSHWYRVRFFDDGNTVYSDWTAPFQSDDIYYCTPREVASFMGRTNFTDSTNPTRFEVEDIIDTVTKEIEKYTTHAWRKLRVSNEYHDVRLQDRYGGYGRYSYDYSTRIVAYLKNRNLRAFTSGVTKIEVWDGSSWVDFVTTYTEGRANDYWINYERGIIYFVNRYPLWNRSNVRLTYDYGETTIPPDIKRAAILLVASYIIGGKEDINIVYPASTMGSVLDPRERWEKWREEAYKLLQRYKEVVGMRYF